MSAFVVACGSSDTASSTSNVDSTATEAPVVDVVKQDSAVQEAPAETK
ncbi:MAG: hypothetical protein ACRC0A_06920 [Chitinophagaceae bacterium]